MEDTKSPNEEDDHFFDASDEFPFYDCPQSFQSSPLPSSSSSLNYSSAPQSTISLSSLPDNSSAGNLRRRRSDRKIYRDHGKATGDFDHRERLEATSTSRNDVVGSVNVDDKGNEENSVITVEVRENEEGQLSWLVFLAELVVKAIGFQFNLLISFVTFPFWGLYYTFMLVINPFHVMVLGRSFLIGKLMSLWKLVCDALSPFLSEWIKEQKSLLNLVLRCGWGLLWSVYVCSILVSLLILAFVIGGFMMRFYVVEEPFQLKQGLNFDYTKNRPEALVPIISCPSVECGKIDGLGNGVRVIPPNHKLQATVTLFLPESDYNRNLGIFQVRVEFLSETGKSLASLSHPCMLKFRSGPLRLLMTFFKIIPLVAGYVSESQSLNLKFRGYTESVIPTACLKVTIEQRAEFRPGAGIPEVYDAFFLLESRLPFLKRILWYWRKTIFVWLSMMLFVMEFLLALVCCRPIIIPRARARSNRTRNSGSLTTHSG